MKFNVALTGEDEVYEWIAEMPAAVVAQLVKTVTKLTLDLQVMIQDQKLLGQVLNLITGDLRASIHAVLPVEVSGDTVTGTVASSGDVKYAGVHEFGFDGEVTVREQVRHMAFGRETKPFVVPSYSYTMHMPMRSFMRTSLDEMTDTIESELVRAVGLGLQGVSS